MTNETKIYWCRKCEAEICTVNPRCPKCGKRMQTQAMVKGLGVANAVVGIAMTIYGLIIVGSVTGLLFAGNSPEAATDYLTIFTYCGIALGGIAVVSGGVWQAKYGRTNKKFVVLLYGLLFLILIFGRFFSF
jgi:hypothetical protein